MQYVLNPKNGRVFKDGPNFAKMRGLVRISDADAEKILGNRLSPSDVVGASVDAEAQAAINAAVKDAVAKSKAKSPDGGGEKKEPTVSIKVTGKTASQLQKEAEDDAAKEKEEAENDDGETVAFGGLTKDTVTQADVDAVPDEQLAAFSNAVLKLTQPPNKAPAEIREQLVKIVAKQEERRAKAEKK